MMPEPTEFVATSAVRQITAITKHYFMVIVNGGLKSSYNTIMVSTFFSVRPSIRLHQIQFLNFFPQDTNHMMRVMFH